MGENDILVASKKTGTIFDHVLCFCKELNVSKLLG